MNTDTADNVKIASTHYDVHPLIRSRWSPRTFSNEAVSDDELMTLFDAARWAASSYNRQPWRFIYARKGGKGYDQLFDLLVEFNQQWVVNAPVLMLTAIKQTTDEGKDNYHALHDLGLAMGNLSLQATAMGIAVHQMAGFDHQKAAQHYQAPENYHFATMVAIGKFGGDLTDLPQDLRKEEQAQRHRKPLSEIVNEAQWSDTF